MSVLSDEIKREAEPEANEIPFAQRSPYAVSPVGRFPDGFDVWLNDASQRFRVPLTLALGAVITATVFFAYRSSIGSEANTTSATTTPAAANDLEPASDEIDPLSDPSGGPASDATGSDSSSPSTVSSSTPTSVGGDDGADDPNGQSPTSSGGGGQTSTTTVRTTTAPPTSASSTTSASTTPTTTPTTTTPTTATTTPETTTTTTAPSGPASMSGRVSFDNAQGPGALGITISLQRDEDGNGTGEGVQASTTTNSDGSFSFTTDPGCYVIAVTVPTGQVAVGGNTDQAVCVTAAQTFDNGAVVISRPALRAPEHCEVQIDDGNGAGVELLNTDGVYADSYAFFGQNGAFILSTASLGPADDFDAGEPSIEWTSEFHNYEESLVYSVAAEHPQGLTSAATQCRREVR